MSLFSVGTLMAALGWGFPSLLAGRLVQASGTAIMMPLLMTTVMELVPPGARGRVMGTISLVISAAPAIGPTVSGLILQFLPWRFVFVLVLPIALAILVVGLRQVPNLNEPVMVKLDAVSVPLAGFGFGGLVYGLSLVGSPTAGWGLEIALAVGVVSLGLFIWRQLVLQRTDSALLDLRTFTHPIFATAIGVMAIAMAALFGTIIALPLILQQVMHAEPLYVGLLLLPGALLTGLLGPVVGRLYDRVGPRWLVVPGSRRRRRRVRAVRPGGRHHALVVAADRAPVPEPRAGVHVHPAVHDLAGRPAAATCTATVPPWSAPCSRWPELPAPRCSSR